MTANGRHARVAELRPDDDLIGWVWAVQSQERLWHDHDHAWHEQAQTGWSDADLYAMLSSYGLLRGKKGAILAGEDKPDARREFGALAVEYANSLKEDDPAENTEVWRSFDIAFRACCVDNGWWSLDERNADWFMPSATLKVMWFTAPSKIPMFDRYAVQGLWQLADRPRKRLPPNRFLGEVASLLERSSDVIASAKAIWGSPYPYGIRIVDKYLWLRGSGQMQRTLDRFHAACRTMSA